MSVGLICSWIDRLSFPISLCLFFLFPVVDLQKLFSSSSTSFLINLVFCFPLCNILLTIQTFFRFSSQSIFPNFAYNISNSLNNSCIFLLILLSHKSLIFPLYIFAGIFFSILNTFFVHSYPLSKFHFQTIVMFLILFGIFLVLFA